MGNAVDRREGRRDVRAAAAETVELDTGREDVGVLLELGVKRLGEGALEGEGAADLVVVLELAASARGVVAAVARAVSTEPVLMQLL